MPTSKTFSAGVSPDFIAPSFFGARPVDLAPKHLAAQGTEGKPPRTACRAKQQFLLHAARQNRLAPELLPRHRRPGFLRRFRGAELFVPIGADEALAGDAVGG